MDLEQYEILHETNRKREREREGIEKVELYFGILFNVFFYPPSYCSAQSLSSSSSSLLLTLYKVCNSLTPPISGC